MIRRCRLFLCDRRAAAAVEFGLLFPMLVILFVGVAELGRAIYQYQVLTKAARDATRYLTRVPDPAANATAQQTARNLALRGTLDTSGTPLLGPEALAQTTVTFTFPSSGAGSGYNGSDTLVQTVISYPFDGLTGYAFASDFTMSVQHVERYIGE